MLNKTDPSKLGKRSDVNIKAYLIEEAKWRLKAFYNSYINFGGGKNQFRQIVRFARERVYSHTAIFVALFNHTTKSEYKTLQRLLLRQLSKEKDFIPIMISAQQASYMPVSPKEQKRFLALLSAEKRLPFAKAAGVIADKNGKLNAPAITETLHFLWDTDLFEIQRTDTGGRYVFWPGTGIIESARSYKPEHPGHVL